MTNTNTGADKKPIIPSITGYPMLDTAIRVLLTSLAASVTTLIVKHLSDMGFNDPNLSIEVGSAVLTVMIGAATVGWSFVQTRLSKNAVVEHTVEALATGQVPDAVKAAAVASPKISDEKIVAAGINAEAIRTGK